MFLESVSSSVRVNPIGLIIYSWAVSFPVRRGFTWGSKNCVIVGVTVRLRELSDSLSDEELLKLLLTHCQNFARIRCVDPADLVEYQIYSLNRFEK